jgi:hypothetical protein
MHKSAGLGLSEAAEQLGLTQHQLMAELSKLRIPNLRIYKGCIVTFEHLASVVLKMKGGGDEVKKRKRYKPKTSEK